MGPMVKLTLPIMWKLHPQHFSWIFSKTDKLDVLFQRSVISAFGHAAIGLAVSVMWLSVVRHLVWLSWV